jgi:hypothetical protein
MQNLEPFHEVLNEPERISLLRLDFTTGIRLYRIILLITVSIKTDRIDARDHGALCRAHAPRALLMRVERSPLAHKIIKNSEKFSHATRILSSFLTNKHPNFLEFS